MVRARESTRTLPFLALATLSFALAETSAAAASAGERRVVVIDVDPSVADALVAALAPWSLAIVRAPGPRPPADVDAAAARARVVASDSRAGAVVWLTPPRPPDEQATLWIYDAETLELAVRPLTVWAPFDEAAAASVALSVKTLLRASPLLAPQSPPEEVTQRTNEFAETRSLVAEPPPSASSPRRPPHAGWRFEAIVGARAPTGVASIEPCAALGGSFWPTRFGDHAGLGLDVQTGSGVSIATRNFEGSLHEATLQTTARLRGSVARWIAFEFEGGPTLVVTSLDGQAAPAGTSLHALRLDPAISVGTVADFMLGTRMSVGVAAVGSVLLRFQRYTVDGSTLLDGPNAVVLFGLRLSMGVD